VAALLLSSAVAAAIGGTARMAGQIGAGAAQGAGEYAAAQAGLSARAWGRISAWAI
jgi:hypothetical protein